MSDIGDWFAIMMEREGDEIELAVERVTIDEGRSFSADALDGLHEQMIAWVGSRIMRRWNETGEPPSLLRVEMKVTVG